MTGSERQTSHSAPPSSMVHKELYDNFRMLLKGYDPWNDETIGTVQVRRHE